MTDPHIVGAPCRIAESIDGQFDIVRLERISGLGQEAGDSLNPMFLRIFLGKSRPADLAVGREANIIELDLVESLLGSLHGQRDVVIPYLFVRWVSPAQPFPVPPEVTSFRIFHRPLWMGHSQQLVFENHNPGNGVNLAIGEPPHERGPVLDHHLFVGADLMGQLDLAGIHQKAAVPLDIHDDRVEFRRYEQSLGVIAQLLTAQTIASYVKSLDVAC